MLSVVQVVLNIIVTRSRKLLARHERVEALPAFARHERVKRYRHRLYVDVPFEGRAFERVEALPASLVRERTVRRPSSR
jgi:hypothetical protein